MTENTTENRYSYMNDWRTWALFFLATLAVSLLFSYISSGSVRLKDWNPFFLVVILCSGFHPKMNKDKAMAMGIRAFVSKPILKRQIAMVVRKVLDHT